jgi:alkaline phosphatase D
MTSAKTLPSRFDRRRFLDYGPMIPFNPHIKYYEGDRRGYFRATVTPQRMQVDLRFMTTVESQAGVGYTEASWVVNDGTPGAHRA